MTGPDDARALLARTPLLVRRGPYALGAWAPGQASAVYQGILRARAAESLVITDEKEVTALVPQAALAELPPPRSVERDFALLTLDLTLAWDVVGVLAAVTAELAAAAIPVGAAAAFSRDHVFVPAARLDEALAALATTCGGVRILG